MPKFLLFLLFVLISGSIYAQTWEFGAGIGGAGYMGELNLTNPVKVSGPSFGVFAKRNFDGYLAVRVNYSFGIISAADSNAASPQFRQRNLSFTTTLSEVSIMGEFNFMNYIPSVGNNRYTPYIFLGVGLLDYVPTTVYNGQKYDLRSLATEGQKKPYSTTAISFPYGAGFKFNISGALTVGGELGYRMVNTGYLDDVSGNYFYSSHNTISQLLSDRSGEKTGVYLGSPNSQRGNSTHDSYFFTHITLSYTFISQKCYYHN